MSKEPKLLWVIAIIIIAIVVGSFVGYNGQDRDEFEAAWKEEFLRTAKPGRYDWWTISVYIDDQMIARGYVEYNGNYYKDGKKVSFDKLPRPNLVIHTKNTHD
jgi:hypothetical protein